MRFNEFKVELSEEKLIEVSMSPTNLKKLSKQINAFCGIEFELYVPDVENSDDYDSDTEPDYDYDESCDSIDQIRRFFSYDNHNDYEIDNVIDSLNDKFQEFYDGKLFKNWKEVADEQVREYIIDYDWDEDDEYEKAYDELELNNEQRAKVEAYRKSSALRSVEKPNPDQSDLFRDTEHPHLLLDQATEIVNDALEDKISYSIRKEDNNYDSARDEWYESADSSEFESDFLQYMGLRDMTDVETEYGLYWPRRTEPDLNGRSMEALASRFEDETGLSAVGCSSYHGCEKYKGEYYVVEKDSSLEGAEPGDSGVEIVSKKLSLPEMIDDLKTVTDWARSNGCYTDHYCGLHMNVSIEDFSLGNLDYVKLALFVGDEYILNQFQRSSNTFCESAISQIGLNIKNNPSNAYGALIELQRNLASLAGKIIHGPYTGKYVSLNLHSNRVEFRSPGDDWLNDDLSKLENTLYRFVVALDIACDRNKYKEEYAKRLYKLIQPSSVQYYNKSEPENAKQPTKFADPGTSKKGLTPVISTKNANDVINLFTRFQAGIVPLSALKSFLLKNKETRQVPSNVSKPPAGITKWTVVGPNGSGEETIDADTPIAAINKYRSKYKLNSAQYPNNMFHVSQAEFSHLNQWEPETPTSLPPQEPQF